MDFKPGFRLSALDALIVVLAIALAVTGAGYSSTVALVVWFVLCHFFLLCNVFRMSRIPEFIWAATFLICAGGSQLLYFPGWEITVFLCVLLTILLVFFESRKPSYHGVLWQRLNPGLPQWFAE